MSDLLEFEPESHTYRVNGTAWPSVTQALGVLNTFAGVPAEFLAAAARFGTHVHSAIDLWNKDELDEAELDTALVPYLRGWRKFIEDSGARVIESERIVRHNGLRYAGRVDSIIEWKRDRFVLDVKSVALFPSVAAQLSAYREAYLQELPGEHLSKTRYCIQLTAEGGYKAHAYKEHARDWNLYLSCLNVWRYLNASA